ASSQFCATHRRRSRHRSIATDKLLAIAGSACHIPVARSKRNASSEFVVVRIARVDCALLIDLSDYIRSRVMSKNTQKQFVVRRDRNYASPFRAITDTQQRHLHRIFERSKQQ